MKAKLIQEPIRTIIHKVPAGRIFDSHFVIARLRKEYPNEYLQFAARLGENVMIKNMNACIAREIKRHGYKQIRPGAYSENILGNPTRCACWQKPI